MEDTRRAQSEQELGKEVRRLAPFHHRVELPHGLSTHVPDLSRRPVEYTRLENVVRHAFSALLEACGGSLEGLRVLDVACNCGGFSVEAHKLGAEYVLGIDLDEHYIEQAQFIKRALGLERVDFETLRVEDLTPESNGLFDVTFCFGILYHLENPAMAMRQIAAVTRGVILVDTNILRTPFVRRSLWEMTVPPVASEDSVDATTSRWRSTEPVMQFRPNGRAVTELLRVLGFERVERLKPTLKGLERRYYEGKRATFIGVRPGYTPERRGPASR